VPSIADLIGREYRGTRVIEHADRDPEPGVYYVRVTGLHGEDVNEFRLSSASDAKAIKTIEAALGPRTR
jgi:hypothetical protein